MREYPLVAMKVLVVGSGAKEHSIIWKLVCSAKYPDMEIIAAPGNAGVIDLVECLDLDETDIDRILELAIVRKIDLTIIGQEALFALGIVDKFNEAGKLICGPKQAASMLTHSHYWAKEFMYRNDIATSNHASFDNLNMAMVYANAITVPTLIRADNPYIIEESLIKVNNANEAKLAVQKFFDLKSYLPVVNKMQGFKPRVIFEEYIEGPEISLTAICDGDNALFFSPVQNYTNWLDEGQGPYFGAMGAYAPVATISDVQLFEIKEKIVDKTLAVLRENGIPYTGILSFDLKLGKEVKLLSYRSGFADSDAQVALPLCDEEIFDLLQACARSNLSRFQKGIKQYQGTALSINLRSTSEFSNQEINFSQINTITGMDDNLEAVSEVLKAIPLIFHESTQRHGDRYIGTGSKVVNATAVAENLVDAQVLAYKLAEKIQFPGKHFRKDIGDQGMI